MSLVSLDALQEQETYEVVVGNGASCLAAIRAADYTWIDDPWITEHLLSSSSDASQTVRRLSVGMFGVFETRPTSSTHQVLTSLVALGWRPATLSELVSFDLQCLVGKFYPYAVVGLGSLTGEHKGKALVATTTRHGLMHSLHVDPIDRVWHASIHRFLAAQA